MSGTQGFASMDPVMQRRIARKGGESVPNEKRSFSRNHQLAAEAGRKGGQSVAPENRSFSRNRELARAAGRKGGERSGLSRHGRTARPFEQGVPPIGGAATLLISGRV